MRLFMPAVAGSIALLVATSTQAQAPAVKPAYKLQITADRPEGIYKSGEEATFSVQLLQDDKPAAGVELNYTLSIDGHKTLSTGKTSSADRPFSVKGKLTEPGFLRLAVICKPDGQTLLAAQAGVGYDPLAIKPSLPVPDDFDEFWNNQKSLLAAVPMKSQLTPVASQIPTVECFDLEVDCLGGKPVSGYFARPKNAEPKSLPAILFVHGAGVRSSSLGVAMSAANRSRCLALDLNAHGIPNGKPPEFYTNLNNGELKQYTQQGRDSRETIYFRGMYLRLIRAIDFLCAQPEWDGKIVIVRGASQGGGQALAAAGLDARVTAFYAGVPALCDHSGNVVDRIAGWPKIVPLGADRKPDAKVLQAARYIDAMNFATRTKAEGIVTVGFIDGTCPPTSIYATYNNLPGRKEMIDGVPYGHREWPESVDRADKMFLEHIARIKGTK
ncbi:MAG: alpha/beta fold hydrolase [Planctomycetia bacterium]|nr:alpha/beta fold hydrolase [Planctomycetia bacterium]